MGSKVVYSKDKTGPSPGRRAKEVDPAPKGDAYSYIVDKYWTVRSVDDDVVTLVTRRGKVHEVPLDDPKLRRANLWERILYANRFPQIDASIVQELSEAADESEPHSSGSGPNTP
mgnify:CR=1 FL=1